MKEKSVRLTHVTICFCLCSPATFSLLPGHVYFPLLHRPAILHLSARCTRTFHPFPPSPDCLTHLHTCSHSPSSLPETLFPVSSSLTCSFDFPPAPFWICLSVLDCFLWSLNCLNCISLPQSSASGSLIPCTQHLWLVPRFKMSTVKKRMKIEIQLLFLPVSGGHNIKITLTRSAEKPTKLWYLPSNNRAVVESNF